MLPAAVGRGLCEQHAKFVSSWLTVSSPVHGHKGLEPQTIQVSSVVPHS